jgi:hypothetical protein
MILFSSWMKKRTVQDVFAGKFWTQSQAHSHYHCVLGGKAWVGGDPVACTWAPVGFLAILLDQITLTNIKDNFAATDIATDTSAWPTGIRRLLIAIFAWIIGF